MSGAAARAAVSQFELRGDYGCGAGSFGRAAGASHAGALSSGAGVGCGGGPLKGCERLERVNLMGTRDGGWRDRGAGREGPAGTVVRGEHDDGCGPRDAARVSGVQKMAGRAGGAVADVERGASQLFMGESEIGGNGRRAGEAGGARRAVRGEFIWRNGSGGVRCERCPGDGGGAASSGGASESGVAGVLRGAVDGRCDATHRPRCRGCVS